MLQYDQYVGSASALVWAIASHFMAYNSDMIRRQWMRLLVEIVGLSILTGPAGAVVFFFFFMWRRDERVLG